MLEEEGEGLREPQIGVEAWEVVDTGGVVEVNEGGEAGVSGLSVFEGSEDEDEISLVNTL